jgi:hypothetical protein
VIGTALTAVIEKVTRRPEQRGGRRVVPAYD